MKTISQLIIIAIAVTQLTACGGGGDAPASANNTGSASGGSSTPAPGAAPATPSTPAASPSTSSAVVRSFSANSDPITIDKLVNTGASGATKAVSANAEFYFGRFMFAGGDGSFYSGSIKFKLNKQDSASAYFSDFTLLNLSKVSSFDGKTAIVTSSTDLKVASSYSAASNSVTIANATSRFVSFSVDFGNNAYLNDVNNAGVIFSSDYTTMAGGNDNFFFIAQKSDSMSNVVENDLDGSWKIIIFNILSGVPKKLSTSTVAIGGVGGNGFIAFTGTNSDNSKFGGEIALNDAAAGSFFYGYGKSASTTASTISGVFLVTPDKALALGVDFVNGTNFAAEK